MNENALKIYIFCCSTSFNVNELEDNLIEQKDHEFKIIGLPCSGKVDLLYLIKSFETGADAAVLLTCKKGECSYFEGNLRAGKRAQAVDQLLNEIGMDGERMAVYQLTDKGIGEIVSNVKDFCNKVKSLPVYDTVKK